MQSPSELRGPYEKSHSNVGLSTSGNHLTYSYVLLVHYMYVDVILCILFPRVISSYKFYNDHFSCRNLFVYPCLYLLLYLFYIIYLCIVHTYKSIIVIKLYLHCFCYHKSIKKFYSNLRLICRCHKITRTNNDILFCVL